MHNFLLPFLLFFSSAFLLFAESVQSYDWSKATELYPGILHAKVALEEPRLLKLNVVRIDLERPEIRFCCTPADPDWGKPMPDAPDHIIRTRRQTTVAFMQHARLPKDKGGLGLNMVMAVNATPWSPWRKPFNHKYSDNMGLVISNGKLVSAVNKRPSFVIYKNGEFAMQQLNEDSDLSSIELALTGFSFVLQDGVPRGDKALHPRTAYGLSKDKKYLFLLTVDGRQKNWSLGATTLELGEWLRQFGAWEGLNMDGGGSTSLACLLPGEEKEKIELLNRTGGGMRRVATNLGIYLHSENKE
ncbi:MAG: phosphodiester glycosidase family protein [Oligosphaeraceae bacterium]|nr:phosphodiester glycosidase family protein [Oligosphaeraceae bacterium]